VEDGEEKKEGEEEKKEGEVKGFVLYGRHIFSIDFEGNCEILKKQESENTDYKGHTFGTTSNGKVYTFINGKGIQKFDLETKEVSVFSTEHVTAISIRPFITDGKSIYVMRDTKDGQNTEILQFEENGKNNSIKQFSKNQYNYGPIKLGNKIYYFFWWKVY